MKKQLNKTQIIRAYVFNKLVIVTLLLVSKLYSQNPSHYFLGKEELKNADVYSILETKNEELYISTNRGLFYFFNKEFKSIPKLKNQKGSSLFSLIENKKGEIFCYNLSGQIFKVTDKKLTLYYTLPEKYLQSLFYLFFDTSDNLIITAKGTFNISNPTKVVTIDTLKVSFASKTSAGEIIINNKIDSLSILKDGIIKCQKISEKVNLKDNHRTTLKINNVFFNYYMEGTILPVAPSKKITLTFLPEKRARYHQLIESETWSLSANKGAKSIVLKEDSLKIKHHFFKNEFISAIHKGKTGTYYFGTFGNGLIVVPNINIKESKLSNNQIRGIAVSPNNTVFFTETNQGIKAYKKGDIIKIKDSVKGKNYHKIYYDAAINFKINKEVRGLFYDSYFLGQKKSSFSAAKDIFITKNKTVLIASTSGLSKIGEDILLDNLSWDKVEVNNYRYSKINKRCKSVVYDSINKQIYLATINKLLRITASNVHTEVFYKGNSISVNKLLLHDNKIWIATQKNGVLIYEKGKITKEINTQNGLLSNNITKITIHDNKLYILSNGKLQYVYLDTNNIVSLEKAEGFISYIDDFAFSNTKLWMLNRREALSSILINKIPSKNPKPKLKLDTILVNNKTIDFKKVKRFGYNQNHFNFIIDVKNITVALNTTIHYRINGIDADWNIFDKKQNSNIVYKSLPIGKHRFEVYAKYGVNKSETLHYNFTIKAPYWQQWWFYVSIGFIILILIYVYFKRRITFIKKKDKEELEKQMLQTNLLDTQLAALRSQMNPHFIFNSLNSIQDLVLKQDTEASYDYIVLFSELVRNTLNYSNQDFISIEKEIAFIEVYLKLEKLRFGTNFQYHIKYEGNEELKVPSLLIQPFIENALLHGLLHKKGEKELFVTFKYTDVLQCIITDNGIGRKASQDINKRQGNNHESFALEAIEKRLEIFKKQYQTKVGYTITDLYENKVAVGTKVVITMPFKKQF
ncbi:histidine kinase [uncultured Tenacibaculum sp.]|uniref:sensor histidine kinase n=1 Tax=uncultured Tenacibaculum sp. TaxID=174713 RepID=UPI002625EA57|nr:histidine kinase [uncultured Tenacibaculum sp.]